MHVALIFHGMSNLGTIPPATLTILYRLKGA